ncbi:MAG: CRTAC1 family protein [Acidobacteriota bacterium]|nr:CRTAC1 family protein [Acidobacteriota bacterium]
MRWPLLIIPALLWAGCGSPDLDSSAESPAFVERAEETGLIFQHENGMSGEFYIIEVIGAGGALVDYDNDGDLDVYLVQGGPLTPNADVGSGPSDRLFRNDLHSRADGSTQLRFTDVTKMAGLSASGYGMGVAAGDYDNDGWVDLYVTRFGSNSLLRNVGDGTFVDVTERSGTDDVRWSVPAVFLDFDADGFLDLFVGNYVDFRYSNHKRCLPEQGFVDYCSPLAYRAESNRLFRNRQDGSFEDVTERAGLRGAAGNTLGAIALDVEGDGDLDIYVANDWNENRLWVNRGDGVYHERALIAGAAVNVDGQPEASMGVLAEDFDERGGVDIFLTHLMGETNTLYRNDGDGNFDDSSIGSGLGEPSWNFTGFGTSSLDYDNDGWADIFVANGAVRLILSLVRRGDPFPLRQTDQLFRNQGDGQFVDRTAAELPSLKEVGRGVAAGDVDNDGDVDLLVMNNNGPVHLLENRVGQRQSWVGFRVIDRHGRDAYDARVVLLSGAGRARTRWVSAGGSYASSGDPRVLFGLAEVEADQAVRVYWRDGTVEEWTGLSVRTYTTLRSGEGDSVVEP